MGAMASQITSLTIVYSATYSGADQRKCQTPRHWPLCGELTGDPWIPAQMASNAENVSIWWRHHDICKKNPISKLGTLWFLILTVATEKLFPINTISSRRSFTDHCSDDTWAESYQQFDSLFNNLFVLIKKTSLCDGITLFQGACIVRMLRDVLGPPAFDRAMRVRNITCIWPHDQENIK